MKTSFKLFISIILSVILISGCDNHNQSEVKISTKPKVESKPVEKNVSKSSEKPSNVHCHDGICEIIDDKEDNTPKYQLPKSNSKEFKKGSLIKEKEFIQPEFRAY